MAQEAFRWKRGCGRRQTALPSGNDDNVEKMRTLVRTDHRLTITMIAEEMNLDKEAVRQILTTDLNMK
jgi:DNA-directed RNA polymerase sigma subunit (sigma70/sigma32)